MSNKVEIYIEEHLVRKIEIDVPSELSAIERMIYAENKAREMYKNEEIILSAEDFNGTVLIESHDLESNYYSGWNNLLKERGNKQ